MPAQVNAWYMVSVPICSGVQPYLSDMFRKMVAHGTVRRDGSVTPPPPGDFSFPALAVPPPCAVRE